METKSICDPKQPQRNPNRTTERCYGAVCFCVCTSLVTTRWKSWQWIEPKDLSEIATTTKTTSDISDWLKKIKKKHGNNSVWHERDAKQKCFTQWCLEAVNFSARNSVAMIKRHTVGCEEKWKQAQICLCHHCCYFCTGTDLTGLVHFMNRIL